MMMFYIPNLVMQVVVKQSKQILPFMGTHIKMQMHSNISASVELLSWKVDLCTHIANNDFTTECDKLCIIIYMATLVVIALHANSYAY